MMSIRSILLGADWEGSTGICNRHCLQTFNPLQSLWRHSLQRSPRFMDSYGFLKLQTDSILSSASRNWKLKIARNSDKEPSEKVSLDPVSSSVAFRRLPSSLLDFPSFLVISKLHCQGLYWKFSSFSPDFYPDKTKEWPSIEAYWQRETCLI